MQAIRQIVVRKIWGRSRGCVVIDRGRWYQGWWASVLVLDEPVFASPASSVYDTILKHAAFVHFAILGHPFLKHCASDISNGT